ncbi:MAG: UDP-N-acetylglucosamine--N-acetylmuramyl-(pentapeptide) pyrophosphoryl-undecaprenol N-acetylglucosamine transferase [Victivallaceae bacterium]
MLIPASKNASKLRRLAITCGGTGGHFYPGLSIAREFKKQRGEVILLLSGKNVEFQAAIAEKFGITAVRLRSMPNPKNIKTTIQFILGTISGTISSYIKLKSFHADAVLGMGSFASMPPAIAARILRIPLFLHDGNARIGKANRILSRWARHLSTAFPAVNLETSKCPCECTGMPLRPEILGSELSKSKAIAMLNEKFGSNLNHKLPTMLIFGGSQGAQIFNEIFPNALKKFQKCKFQVIHLSGEGKFDALKAVYENVSFPVLALPSAAEMDLFYQAADVVVCRSGGSTVAELTLFGKFSFLIPYPFAAEKHQDDNARFLAASGAAEIIDNADCTPERIKKIIEKWLNNPEKYADLGAKAKALAMPDAADAITWKIIRMIL